MTPPFLWFSAAFCNENSQHPDLQDDRGLSDESQGDTEKIKMMKMAVSLNPSHYQTKTILTNLVLNLSTAFTIVSIIFLPLECTFCRLLDVSGFVIAYLSLLNKYNTIIGCQI